MSLVINCPVCSHPMKETAYNRVMIDCCQRCKGIWLDYGELEIIVSSVKKTSSLEKDCRPNMAGMRR